MLSFYRQLARVSMTYGKMEQLKSRMRFIESGLVENNLRARNGSVKKAIFSRWKGKAAENEHEMEETRATTGITLRTTANKNEHLEALWWWTERYLWAHRLYLSKLFIFGSFEFSYLDKHKIFRESTVGIVQLLIFSSLHTFFGFLSVVFFASTLFKCRWAPLERWERKTRLVAWKAAQKLI